MKSNRQIPVWTKFRKLFKDNLPDSLKNSIDIQMIAYRKTARCGQRIKIIFEKKIILDAPDEVFDWQAGTDHMFTSWKFQRKFMEYIQEKHEKTAFSDDYYFTLFSLLDKRTGKRTLRKYYPQIFLQTVISGNSELENVFRIRFAVEGIEINESVVAIAKFVTDQD